MVPVYPEMGHWINKSYHPLHSAHAGTLGVHGLIREPQTGVDVLDVTNRVSVFDIGDAHSIYFFFHPGIQFFLKRMDVGVGCVEGRGTLKKQNCIVYLNGTVPVTLHLYSPCKCLKGYRAEKVWETNKSWSLYNGSLLQLIK